MPDDEKVEVKSVEWVVEHGDEPLVRIVKSTGGYIQVSVQDLVDLLEKHHMTVEWTGRVYRLKCDACDYSPVLSGTEVSAIVTAEYAHKNYLLLTLRDPKVIALLHEERAARQHGEG